MTGYLTTLVARSTGETPGVRPRPVSRFEPPAPMGLPAALVADAHPADLAARAPRVSDGPGKPVPPAIDTIPLRSRPTVAPRTTVPAARTEREPAVAETHQLVGPPAQLGYLLQRPAPPTLRSSWEPAPLPALDAAPAPEPPQKPGEPPRGSPSALQAARPEMPRVHPSAAGPRRPDGAPSIRPTPEPVRAPVQSSPGRTTQGEPSPAEPIIHVTIGRVEVIAMPPAGPAAKEAAPAGRRSAVMSLDEYLKRREEEGRK